MSKKQQHSESGRHRNERRAHDAAVRHYDDAVYTKPAQPKWVRYVLLGLVVLVVASITLLFIGGFIRW